MKKNIISIVAAVSIFAGFVSSAQAGYNIYSFTSNSATAYGTGSNSGSSVTCYRFSGVISCN